MFVTFTADSVGGRLQLTSEVGPFHSSRNISILYCLRSINSFSLEDTNLLKSSLPFILEGLCVTTEP